MKGKMRLKKYVTQSIISFQTNGVSFFQPLERNHTKGTQPTQLLISVARASSCTEGLERVREERKGC